MFTVAGVLQFEYYNVLSATVSLYVPVSVRTHMVARQRYREHSIAPIYPNS